MNTNEKAAERLALSTAHVSTTPTAMQHTLSAAQVNTDGSFEVGPRGEAAVPLNGKAHDQFKAAMRAAGLAPPDVIEADGDIHRFATNDKHDDKSGWYVLHLNDIPTGTFGDWRRQFKQNWRMDMGRKLTPAEEVLCKTQEDEMRCKREAEEEQNREHAREWATDIWPTLTEADIHPYLTKKGIKAHGARSLGQALIVPLCVGTEIHSIQYIWPDGTKRFLEGGRVRGGYFPIGTPDRVLCIAEGFATGASIHEATGYPVAVAFNAGNLLAVAKAMREKYPDIRLVLCADDDIGTKDNPGLTKATEAARAVDGYLAIPDFGEDRPEKATDFNDLARHRGAEAVKAAIGKAQSLFNARANGKGACVTLIRGSTIQPKPIQWEWKNWLARGMFHIQAGAPGGGKTTIGISFAATVTVGGKWPDGTPSPIGDVLIWSGEDNPEYILLPRFLAAGGDPRRVYFIDCVTDSRGKRSFDPATDIEGLLEAIRGLPNLSYVMIDPVVNAVLGDGNKNAEVRRALQPLVDLAAERNVVLFGITHFSKGTAGRDPVERVNGSVAFGALPRVVMAAAKVRERGENGEEIERRIFCRTKSNIGPDTGGWEYKLALTDVPGYPEITVTRVVWGKELTGSARELLAEAEACDPEERGDLEACKDFLRGLLSGGPVLRNQVKADAEGAVHAWRTVERAKKALGVISVKAGMKEGWLWRLPPVVGDIL